ncbi:hypothetical protein ACFFLS_07110 [Flavobacterium procerum]|uniref:Peptidase S74 domain-containing protein n=1 Tax=Flavobacterium procerum TaxID=1455569 RepID=A0ABV6BQ99_9FLAO
MKKITLMLLVIQSGIIMAQTKTVVTQFGEKVTINPNIGNGLTANNGSIELGGTLSGPAQLTTSSTNTLAFTGLSTGAAADDILVTDASGILKKVAASTLQLEPWQIKSTTTKAGSNTDNIFQMGQVGIGTNNMLGTVDANVKLAVNGTIILPSSYYADYVFEDYLDGQSNIKAAYKFKTLTEVEQFILQNKHLPGVTGIKDLARNEKGQYIFNMNELSIQSLEKIEELYLHLIEQNKQIEADQKTISEMNSRVETLEKLVKQLLAQ